MLRRSLRQILFSALGVAAWIGAVAAWMAGAGAEVGLTVVGMPLVGGTAILLAAVFARMPVLGRPVLLLLHVLAVVGVAEAAGEYASAAVAWPAALAGYLGYALLRRAGAPRRGGASPALHLRVRPRASARR